MIRVLRALLERSERSNARLRESLTRDDDPTGPPGPVVPREPHSGGVVQDWDPRTDEVRFVRPDEVRKPR